MRSQYDILEFLKNDEPNILLHENDWQKLLGQNLYSKMLKSNSLVKPSVNELHEKIINYYFNDTPVTSEIYWEHRLELAYVSPFELGYEVLKRNLNEIGILKSSTLLLLEHLRQINFLEKSQVSSRNEFLTIGEYGTRSLKNLIVLYTGQNTSGAYLNEQIKIAEWEAFDNVIILSGKLKAGALIAINNGVNLVAYSSNHSIPDIAFSSMRNRVAPRDIALQFRPPILIDSNEKYVYFFGKKITERTDTKLYRFIKALRDCYDQLPMSIENFFKSNPRISTEAHTELIKALRKDLKKIILDKIEDQNEREILFNYFDLKENTKIRGMIDLKINLIDLHYY